jgi:hypothetical protein
MEACFHLVMDRLAWVVWASVCSATVMAEIKTEE